jgi:hypothetical protein
MTCLETKPWVSRQMITGRSGDDPIIGLLRLYFRGLRNNLQNVVLLGNHVISTQLERGSRVTGQVN